MTTYHSVAEIFEAMDKTRERLRGTLAGLSAAEESFRESPDRWSIAEIVEHLAIIEGNVVRLAGKLVGKAEADGAKRASGGGDGEADGGNGGGGGRIPPVSLGEIIERATKEKFNAPEAVVPTGGASIADSLARLDQSRDAMRALRPRIEAAELSAYRFPHPVFGPLDLYHWLAVSGLHEERHRRQIEALKASATGQAAAQP